MFVLTNVSECGCLPHIPIPNGGDVYCEEADEDDDD
jgi:hypothetical protein